MIEVECQFFGRQDHDIRITSPEKPYMDAEGGFDEGRKQRWIERGWWNPPPPFQDELTPFLPTSPYAVAKLAAHNLVKIYREAYGLFACSGILHNHESPRRGHEFVTRKITSYIGKLSAKGFAKVGTLKLGNIEACRDWGHAKDYVLGQFLMLQNEVADDFVLATGKTHSVKDFLELAFGCVNLKWQDYVEISSSEMRPSEVPYLRGDASKAKAQLGWGPTVTFEELVKEMVMCDLENANDNG